MPRSEPTEPRIIYLRQSHPDGPVELVIGMGRHTIEAIYVLNRGQLANLVVDGARFALRRHVDSEWDQMWRAPFQYPDRVG